MPQVVWSPTASQDLERHYNFLLTQDAITATKAVQKIIKTGGSLAQSPYRGLFNKKQDSESYLFPLANTAT
jgi:plasmid stabilization system protein ParE